MGVEQFLSTTNDPRRRAVVDSHLAFATNVVMRDAYKEAAEVLANGGTFAEAMTKAPTITQVNAVMGSRKAAVEPITARLPKGTGLKVGPIVRSGREVGLSYVPLSPPLLEVPHPERRAKAEAATHHIAGFAGTDGTLQGEAVSLIVFTFSDIKIAEKIPTWMAEGFRSMVPIFRRAGVSITQLDVSELRGVKADSNQMIRAGGRDTEAGKAWTNVQLRATRGNRMVELVLRNVTMSDEDMITLVNDTLDRIALLPADAPPEAEQTD